MQAAPVLPKLGEAFQGGVYAGVSTGQDGGLYVPVLLGHKPPRGLDWYESQAWVESLGASVPTRSEAALLFANVRPLLKPELHWTAEGDESDPFHAWVCHFGSGHQYNDRAGHEHSAIAIRRIPLATLNPLAEYAHRATTGSAALRRAALELLAAADKADTALKELS